MKHVFLSYKSENEASVKALKDVLERNGIQTWLSCNDVEPGSDFSEDITQAIENCYAFVLMLTPEAQESPWIANEIKTAIDCKKPLFPVQLTQTPLNDSFRYLLRSSQTTTLSRLDDTDPSLQRLISILKDHRDGKVRKKSSFRQSGPAFNGKWLGIAGIVAVALFVTFFILVGSLVSKGLSIFDGFASKWPTIDTSSVFDSTLPPADPSATNQILECHEDLVLALKHADSSYVKHSTIHVNVGEAASISTVWPDYTLYSEDTGIAMCEGVLIHGVSPGTTYVVLASSKSMAKAYRIIVEEPTE